MVFEVPKEVKIWIGGMLKKVSPELFTGALSTIYKYIKNIENGLSITLKAVSRFISF